jgi:hypothetical protein
VDAGMKQHHVALWFICQPAVETFTGERQVNSYLAIAIKRKPLQKRPAL